MCCVSSGSRERPGRPAGPTDRRPLPGALVIIVIVITVIFVLNRQSGGGGDPEQIGTAVSGQNDALQRQDYQDFVKYTCKEQQARRMTSLPGNVIQRPRAENAMWTRRQCGGERRSRHRQGDLPLNNAPDTLVGADLVLVREDGSWKICSATPG